MTDVKSTELKARLSHFLDAVERGETVGITRHGRRIGKIVPETEDRQAAIRRARAEIEEARKTAPRVTVEEILAWRDEGRR
ncbi:MAG: type II toxin-antitoxin system prevent-host-death family antitoxin [Rhizobiales bacterium]|jgi:prevent-host-death family protein|nr:type II toxin-antitoxin system prevent-host-death family antitoxin [Hyphomicrobiales bacterium]